MAYKKSITILINRSSGELEWLYPIIVSLEKNEHPISLIFIQKKEFNYFRSSRYMTSELGTENISIKCYEEWFNSTSEYYKYCIKLIQRLHRILALISKSGANYFTKSNGEYIKQKRFAKVNKIENQVDLLMFDNSFYKDLERFSSRSINHAFYDYFLPQNILIFPHSTALRGYENSYRAGKTCLNWRKNVPTNSFYWKISVDKAGNTRMVTDCQFSAQQYFKNRGLSTLWVKPPRFSNRLLNKRITQELQPPCVLILSKLQGALFAANPAVNPLNLIRDIVLECELNNINWMIKPHPRDDIEKIIDMLTVTSTRDFLDNAFYKDSIYDMGSKFSLCISLPTSAVLDSVSFGIPTIEYFVDDQNILGSDKYCSDYSSAGIVVSCGSKSRLRAYIDSYAKHESCLKQLAADQNNSLRQRFNGGGDLFQAITQLLTKTPDLTQ